jgi:hypothetical protein
MTTYDSTKDTLTHIANVQNEIGYIALDLIERGNQHDWSKLQAPEKEALDVYTPLLKDTTYDGPPRIQEPQFQAYLAHHYALNSHHPEFYTYGIDDMTLMDIIEMLCDWHAATLRHADGSIAKSLEINRTRFKIGDQLLHILENTALALGWIAHTSERNAP